MDDKKAEVIDISINELALSLVGWQVEEAQARLVTESVSWRDPFQQIAVSAVFRFLPEDWIDRFQDSTNRDYVPAVFINLNKRNAPAPSGVFNCVDFESIGKASRGLIRVAAASSQHTYQTPLTAKDFDLQLTAYDLHTVHARHIGTMLLPGTTTIPIEIIVVDETSVGAPRPNVTAAHAFLSKGSYASILTIHTEGNFQFGTAEDLLKVYWGRQDFEEKAPSINDAAPFKVTVPQIRFEILDKTGFLLHAQTDRFSGHIPVDDQGNVPCRQPRWMGRYVIPISELPGDPHRVVVRMTDSER